LNWKGIKSFRPTERARARARTALLAAAYKACSGKWRMKAQGAIRSAHSSPTYCLLLGQGATEYLVLLAVVLIVALVSVALLGFFPGMASDAQITQSQMYWKSAQPLAIVEMTAGGATNTPTDRSLPYFRLRNTGAYRITLTKVCGSNGDCATQTAIWTLSNMVTLAPGEEYYLGVGGAETRQMDFWVGAAASSGMSLYGLSSSCSPNSPYGTMVMKNFAFEYIEYIDGQQITKRQKGSQPLVMKCNPPRW